MIKKNKVSAKVKVSDYAVLLSPVITEKSAMVGATGQTVTLKVDPRASKDEIRGAIARLTHSGHDAMLLQTLDRQELRFQIESPSRFEGLEGGMSLETDPRAVRAAYLELLREHIEAVNRIARGFGADALVFDTHESVGPVLGALLDRRAGSTGRTGG